MSERSFPNLPTSGTIKHKENWKKMMYQQIKDCFGLILINKGANLLKIVITNVSWSQSFYHFNHNTDLVSFFSLQKLLLLQIFWDNDWCYIATGRKIYKQNLCVHQIHFLNFCVNINNDIPFTCPIGLCVRPVISMVLTSFVFFISIGIM